MNAPEATCWTLIRDGVYADDVVSGALTVGRERFEELVRAAAAKRFDVVVVEHQDRIARASVTDCSHLSRAWGQSPSPRAMLPRLPSELEMCSGRPSS